MSVNSTVAFLAFTAFSVSVFDDEAVPDEGVARRHDLRHALYLYQALPALGDYAQAG